MEFHYVVMYDDRTGKWGLEDESRYLDGNLYDNERDGWHWPEEGTADDTQDRYCRSQLLRALEGLV